MSSTKSLHRMLVREDKREKDGGLENGGAIQSITSKSPETISDLVEPLRYTKCAVIHFLSEPLHF